MVRQLGADANKQGITVSNSLGYTTSSRSPSRCAAARLFADRFERKWIIVAAAIVTPGFGLVFGQAREAAIIIAMGVL